MGEETLSDGAEVAIERAGEVYRRTLGLLQLPSPILSLEHLSEGPYEDQLLYRNNC